MKALHVQALVTLPCTETLSRHSIGDIQHFNYHIWFMQCDMIIMLFACIWCTLILFITCHPFFPFYPLFPRTPLTVFSCFSLKYAWENICDDCFAMTLTSYIISNYILLFMEKHFFLIICYEERRKPSPTKIIRQWFWLAQALTVEKPEHKLSFGTNSVLSVPSDTPKTLVSIIFVPNYTFVKIT